MLMGEPDFTFHHCVDPQQVERVVRDTQPTLILLDIQMPQRDGFAVLDALRRQPATRQIPVIMMSTREEPETKAMSFARGAHDYIVKMPSRIELMARIRHHARGYVAQLERDAAFFALEKSREALAQANQELQAEMAKSDRLLLNILPARIAAELKQNGSVAGVLHDDVAVMFTDFSGFTRVAVEFTPGELVAHLNECFSEFDAISLRHRLERLKTIGDGYMCIGGLAEHDSLEDVLDAAVEMRDYVLRRKAREELTGRAYWSIRIGIHIGPVVAGVVGISKFAFDVWGSAVNLASRLESASEPGRINVSRAVYERIADDWECQPRGLLPVKNHPDVEMFFVEGRKNKTGKNRR
jgi:class 3 adenylate cyclase